MRREPGTRLILIFILTVIISGGILTYLSINSISNFKELTEKKVSEEQKSVIGKVSSQVQERIDETAIRFNTLALKEGAIDWNSLDTCDTLEFVEHPFAVSGEGEFLWPRFMEGPRKYQEEVQSKTFQQEFRKAEIAEFREQDLQKAVIHYKATLMYSSGKPDSVMVLNALGRLYQKKEDFEKAFISFASINSEYSSILNRNGFPYVYYAILNMMRSTDPTYRSRVLTEIDAFLLGLSTGTIPINNSTRDILVQINDWVNRSGEVNEIQNSRLVEHTEKIHRRIDLIDRYSHPIRESLEQGHGGQFGLVAEKFHVISDMQGRAGEIILIAPIRENSVGFIMEINHIWSAIMNSGYFDHTEFEYAIDLIGRATLNGYGSDEMGTASEFSTLFPDHLIRISLVDNNIIDVLAKRRSWTYGIALVLLLGAMSLGVLLILRDILREKHLSRLRSDFIANVTHELKTPLTSIHLFTESFQMGRVKKASDKKEFLNIILKETERLKRMINNILDFSKGERDKPEYNFEQVNVSDLVSSALNDLDYWLVERDFKVETRIEENVTVAADPDALKQAIINLLSNAIKFSRDKKEISIRLSKEKEAIKIEVEDKGIGIAGDQKHLIFDKFYRVGQKNAEDISGTGLGLTVVKGIVEGHHGRILVESELNKGSKFTIILNSFLENRDNGHINY